MTTERIKFNKQKFEGFINYSIYLKHIKGLISSELQPNDGCSLQDLLDHLETNDPLDIYVFKVCALWESQPRIAQELVKYADSILDSVHTLIKQFLGEKESSSEETKLEALSLTKAMSLAGWLQPHTQPKPLLLQDIHSLILSPACLVETALLGGVATMVGIQSGSSSDEETISLVWDTLANMGEAAWGRLCIVQGVLAHSTSTLLLGQHTACQEDSTLILQLYPVVRDLCRTPSTFSFHCFSLLRQWSSRLADICFQVSAQTDNTFSVQVPMDTVKDVLGLCSQNLDNSTKGISEACVTTYRNILSLLGPVWAKEKDSRWSLLTSLLTQTLSLPWSQKSKYSLLECLIPEIGVHSVLSHCPSLTRDLITSLTCPHLVHTGLQLYKTIITSLTPSEWEEYCGCVILHCLTQDPLNVRKKCLDHWLPHTLLLHPTALHWLHTQLSGRDTEPALMARLAILTLKRNSGQEEEEEKEEEQLLKRCILHPDPELRSGAFAAICQARKKGSVPPSWQLSLCLSLIDDCSTGECTRYRQKVTSSFAILMSRCRDYAAHKTRNNQWSHLEEVLQFLDRSVSLLMFHVLPGGNYHRRILALDLLLVFANNFVVFSSSKGSNRRSGNGDPSVFMARCKEMGKVELVTQSNLSVLVLCLEDHMTDVVEKTEELLRYFTPSQTQLEEMADRMVTLIHSGKEGECYSGAVMAGLLHTWKFTLKENQLWVPGDHTHIEDSSITQCVPPSSILHSGCVSLVTLPDQLLQLATLTLTRCRSHLVSASRFSPLHGVLAGLRRCLTQQISDTQVETVLHLVRTTVDLMLRLLGGRLDVSGEDTESFEECPDFLQMAAHIERRVNMDTQGETGQTTEETVEVSDTHQRVLSMAWHCLKECCHLTTHLVRINSLTADQVSRCSQIYLAISSTCRHKGALEAANLTCGSFCSMLLQGSYSVSHESLPLWMLQSVLSMLTSSWSRSSFTRRSAGLPGLVTRLVAAEPAGKTRVLLPVALTTLLQYCKEPSHKSTEEIQTQDSTSSHGTQDSTSSHALHVLRGLVQDAVIARDLGPHIVTLVTACLDTFTSKSWAVRNAGLQLYGALVPRIVGQVKVRDTGDMAGFNRIELGQVVSRYPGLLQLLLDTLEESGGETRKEYLVSPMCVPILTLLARMESRESGESLTHRLVHAVTRLCHSPVIQVRELCARVLSLHKPDLQADTALETVLHCVKEGGMDTNTVHCNILLVRYLVSQCRYTSPTTVCSLLSQCDQLTSCFLIKREAMVAARIVRDQSGVQESLVGHQRLGWTFEPGFHEWLESQSDSVLGCGPPTSTDTLTPSMLQLRSSPSPASILSQLTSILTSPSPSSSKLTPVLSLLLPLLTPQSQSTPTIQPDFPLMPQSELALEVLECLEDPTLSQQGPTVTSLVGTVKAAALSGMMLQEDWDWWFGDQSMYVSVMVEGSEAVLAQSHHNSREDCRLQAARTLLVWLPVLQTREVGGMTLVLQYGWVNLVNTALLLLQDEEPEVRALATQFASQLPRTGQSPQWSQLTPQLATECLLFWALTHLHQVSSMLTPVCHLLTKPASLNLEDLLRPRNKQGLFSRGDGINVYSEDSYTLHLYYRCIRIYLQSGGNLTADIQVSSLLTLGESLVSILSNESALFPDSRKGEKFSCCLSFLLLVSLLCEFPDLVCSPCMDTDHIHKCRDLLHRLGHVSLCGRFLDVSTHLDTLMLG